MMHGMIFCDHKKQDIEWNFHRKTNCGGLRGGFYDKAQGTEYQFYPSISLIINSSSTFSSGRESIYEDTNSLLSRPASA